jgi:hypothetical protein
MFDEAQTEKAKALVNKYLDVEGKFKAETMEAVGEINARKKKATDAILLQAGKLEIGKAAFKAAVVNQRHVRDAISSVEKVLDDEDVLFAGQASSVILAVGDVLPLLEKERVDALDDAVRRADATVEKGPAVEPEEEDVPEEKPRRRPRSPAAEAAAAMRGEAPDGTPVH